MAKLPELDDLNVLYKALENADKAGDVEGARELTKYILQQEELAKDPERLSLSEKAPPELAAAIGAATGAGLKTAETAAQIPFKMGEKFGQGFASKMPNFPSTPPATNISPIVQGTGAAHWLESMTGTNVPGGQMNKAGMNIGNRLASIVQPGGEFAGGELKGGIALPPDIRARKPVPSVVSKPSVLNRMANAPMRGLEKVGSAVAPYASAAGKFLNPVAALGGAGYAGADAYNRHQVGDITGEILSLIGGAGSLASMVPHPLVKGAGMGAAMGAEAINAYRDKVRRGEIKHEAPNYENVNPAGDIGYAEGGLAHMADGRQPPEETGAAFGKFPQMNPKRAQPQGGALQGYLDAFLGAPEYQELSVLDPKGMAYKKAYEAAEPYGMAANVIDPLKALGTMGAAKVATALAGKSALPFAAGMGAIKFKGGNTPLGLGSILPLEQQGDMGRFLAKSQITNPLTVFESNLKTHYDPNQFNRKNLKLNREWQNYWEDRKSSIMDDMPETIFNNPNSPEMLKAKKEAAEDFSKWHNNLAVLGAEDAGPRLYGPSAIEAIAPHYNSWVNGPLKSHITKTMGTGLETDQMLKVMNESPFEPQELFGGYRNMAEDPIAKSAANRRDLFTERLSGGWNLVPELEEKVKNSPVGKQTATTPIGKYYEDLIDKLFYPQNQHSYNKELFPGATHLKRNDVVSDFMGLPDESLGFNVISKRVLDGLLSGDIPVNKLTSQTPANVLQSMIKEKTDAIKALKKDENAYKTWRQSNHDALPAETNFTDMGGNPNNRKLVIFDSKTANENPDLVIRNLSQDTKDLNHCGGSCGRDNDKYIPMVTPHTGVENKGTGDYGRNYFQKIKDGRISIASLRGADGESKATLELSRDHNGKLQVNQLKGYRDKEVDAETANDLKNWLNHKFNTGELSNQPISDFKNLPDVYDLDSNNSLLEFARSENPKVNRANDLLLEAISNKLKANPELKSKYQNGYASLVEVMSPELGRFITPDDIISKFGTK